MLPVFLLSILLAICALQGTSSELAAEVSMDSYIYRVWMPMQTSTAPDSVRAGEAFITNLPEIIRSIEVSRYIGVSLPARSWLLNRTFFWKTTNGDLGSHDLMFRAFMSNGGVDSVSVHIVVH